MEKHRKLRVLFLPAWYPSIENPVAGVFIMEHAKAVSLFSDVTVLYCEKNEIGVKGLCKTVSDKIEDGIRTIRIRHKVFTIPKVSFFVNLWAVFVSFRKLIRDGWRPDVIHAHIYYAGVPAILLGKMYKLPVVVTEQFTGFPLRSIKGFNRLLAKLVFEQASLVCPVSKYLQESIQSYGIQAKFKVIANVVDTSLFFPITVNCSKNIKCNKKQMLFVALFDPKKGVPYLLEALNRLKRKRSDFILDIVGDGPNRFEYEEMVREKGLSDFVRFHGIKAKQEVAKFMKHCDFFVLPSRIETFGVVFIEALACGKPVVGPDIGGPNEIITTDVGKLVPPADIDALTAAIDHMHDHYKEYFPEKIAQYARDRFSYEIVGKTLEEVYREVILK